jgi:hypothetical protein
MEKLFTIPLISVPQTFNIVMGGRQLTLTSKWNENSGWLLDFYDGVTTDPLVMAVPLVTGANLLEQYEYLGIPGALVVMTDGDEFAEPTETNLGSEANLYYLVDVE